MPCSRHLSSWWLVLYFTGLARSRLMSFQGLEIGSLFFLWLQQFQLFRWQGYLSLEVFTPRNYCSRLATDLPRPPVYLHGLFLWQLSLVVYSHSCIRSGLFRCFMVHTLVTESRQVCYRWCRQLFWLLWHSSQDFSRTGLLTTWYSQLSTPFQQALMA